MKKDLTALERYRAMSIVEKLALFIACSVDPVEPDSRYELEELQLFGWTRLSNQERGDAMRRARAMERMLRAERLLAQEPPKDLILRIDRVMRAPANVWSVGDIIGLLGECSKWFAAFSPVRITAGQLAKADEPESLPAIRGPFMMPIDRCTPADVLRIFRAFIMRNVTQWAMGAGDHHHPIWEQVALNVEGDDATQGAEWAYIQPENRKPLAVLDLEFADQQAAHAAEERGG